MKLRILGCSGGIGAGLHTTSFLLDESILIDAGTGVQDLTIAELTRIDQVFLTHSHLDHIASLPLMIDSVGSLRTAPVTVHALPETIQALRDYIFNWTIWPDFTAIPDPSSPWLAFEPLTVGQSIDLERGQINPLRASHTVPALGFHIQAPSGSLVFSGDTGPNPEFWPLINAIPDLRHLIVETAFSNHEKSLALSARHLFPDQLQRELQAMTVRPELWITHLKPSDAGTIAAEVQQSVAAHHPRMLCNGQLLEF